MRAIKILGTARPGETIRIEAQITGRLGNLVQARTRVSVNDVTLMQGDLTLSGSSAFA